MRIIILTSIFLQVAMSGCQVPADQAELPSNFPETVFYQIYTRGFCDSDGDGIGDLNGITSKLDYLEDLGVGALWIMPLFSAPTVHKYFAGDFLTVDPEYGTADDLRNLVAEAHKHNIKVLIDFSINHVSYHHSWFQKSMQGDSTAKYREYFHWVRSKEDYNPENHSLDGVHDTAFDKNYKRAKAGSGAEDEWYYARFLDAPDLNYDNPEIREYMLKVGRYWLKDVGVDGFRLDAARHIYDIESTWPVTEKDRNFIWWKSFCEEMKSCCPDAFLLGEIWSNTEVMASYLDAGMNAVFNFHFASAMIKSVKEESNVGLTDELLKMYAHYETKRADFGVGTFLVNHDMARLLNQLEFDEQKVRLATSILLTYPGSPFIFYGEELGYTADRWLVWLPMLWDEQGADPGIVSWMFDDSISKTLISPPPANALHGIDPLPVQMKNEKSLYHHYRRMIRLRQQSRVLTSGELERSEISNEKIVAFYRVSGKESLLVIHNLTPATQEIDKPENTGAYSTIYYSSDENAEVNDLKIVLPAYSTLILNK